MIEVKSKNECCGCGACISVCNHGAISWTSDSEGFFYPQVDKIRINASIVNCVIKYVLLSTNIQLKLMFH